MNWFLLLTAYFLAVLVTVLLIGTVRKNKGK